MSIPAAIEALGPEMTRWRRHLHAHPELGYEERETAAFVAEKLKSFGVDEVVTGLAKTGVVGVIHGRRPGNRAVGLRADMDALPIQETSGVEWSSQSDGRMHACGHDGHTTMLLGAARHLAETRDFAGTVVLIFQPAEEGGGGARVMMDEGLFERFPVDAVYGLHNWPYIPRGTFGMCRSASMAATDEIRIEIAGRGGHGAMPHTTKDPLVCATQLVSALQGIISRETDPMDRAVLSITAIHSGDTFNVVPDKATLQGTVRTFRAETRQRIVERIGQMTKGFGEAFAMKIELFHRPGYPATINHAAEGAFGADVAAELVGEAKVDRDPLPSMAGEDFAFMLQDRPGAYIWLGMGGADEGRILHNPNYDFDDGMLTLGTAWWVRLAEKHLAPA